MLCALVCAACATEPPRVVSVEACYHAVLTDSDATVLRARGWPLVEPGDLVLSRACADEEIARLADEIRALTSGAPAPPP